jgi:Zn finger protein HypA/HybF involved in hydrogenase expression
VIIVLDMIVGGATLVVVEGIGSTASTGRECMKARAYNVVSLTCLECRHVFKRSLARMHGVRCPKCKGVDLELSA